MTPEALASTDAFVQENATTWTARLDTRDDLLVAFMAGKRPTAMLLELMVIVDNERQTAPNVPVTVQASFISDAGIDGGAPSSTFDDEFDGGTPSSTFSAADEIDGGTPVSTY